MWELIVDFIIHIPENIVPFLQVLTYQVPLLNISFLEILTFGGFIVIFGLHVAHLVNVVSG